MNITTKRNVITVRHEFSEPNEEFEVMLSSDHHYDSVKCDLKLLKEDLAYANEKEMLVIMAGDFFDAMQGHDDPRRNPDELKAIYKVSSYFDALVKDGAKFLSNYPKCKFILALGNHETSVLKHHGTNLLDRVADRLRDKYEMQAQNAPYAGWVRFMFSQQGKRDSKTLIYHHGKGGNSPVTKGVIQTNRNAASFLADIHLNGHTHTQYYLALPRYSINAAGQQVLKNEHHVRTPGYKMNAMEHYDQFGYDLEKHPTPNSRGCAIARFSRPDHATNKTKIRIEPRLN